MAVSIALLRPIEATHLVVVAMIVSVNAAINVAVLL